MKVPSLRVGSDLYLLAYTTPPAMQDQGASATYTAVNGNAGSLSH